MLMDKDNTMAGLNQRLSETESSRSPRESSPRAGKPKSDTSRSPHTPAAEPKPVQIVVKVAPLTAPVSEPADSSANNRTAESVAKRQPEITSTSPKPSPQRGEGAVIPARMMNEFVYCQRLFYYEFVEGVFVESVDTLRGGAIHKRVDSGNGSLPAAKTR
jgi:hypothetical protein